MKLKENEFFHNINQDERSFQSGTTCFCSKHEIKSEKWILPCQVNSTVQKRKTLQRRIVAVMTFVLSGGPYENRKKTVVLGVSGDLGLNGM